jgi:hypothetical protein
MPDKTIQEGIPTQLFGDWATIANFQASFVMGAPGVLSVASNNIAVANAGRLATFIVSYDTQSITGSPADIITLTEGLDTLGYAVGNMEFVRGINEVEIIFSYAHFSESTGNWVTHQTLSISGIGIITNSSITPLSLRGGLFSEPAVNTKYFEDPDELQCAVRNRDNGEYTLKIGRPADTGSIDYNSSGAEIDSLVIKLDGGTYLQGYVDTVAGMLFTLRLIFIERMDETLSPYNELAILAHSNSLIFPFSPTGVEALSGTQMSKVPGSSNKIILAGFKLNGTDTNRDLVVTTVHINKFTGSMEFSSTRTVMENATNTSGVISLEYLPSKANEAVVCWAPAEDSTLPDRAARCFTVVTGLDYSNLLGVVAPVGAPTGYINMVSLGSIMSDTTDLSDLSPGICYIDPNTHLPSSNKSSEVLGIYDKINNNVLLKELSYD